MSWPRCDPLHLIKLGLNFLQLLVCLWLRCLSLSAMLAMPPACSVVVFRTTDQLLFLLRVSLSYIGSGILAERETTATCCPHHSSRSTTCSKIILHHLIRHYLILILFHHLLYQSGI